MEPTEPYVLVTPWSKTPSKTYEGVDTDIVCVPEQRRAMLLLTKKNGFSMAITLSAEAIEDLYKSLTEVRRRFKKETSHVADR